MRRSLAALATLFTAGCASLGGASGDYVSPYDAPNIEDANPLDVLNAAFSEKRPEIAAFMEEQGFTSKTAPEFLSPDQFRTLIGILDLNPEDFVASFRGAFQFTFSMAQGVDYYASLQPAEQCVFDEASGLAPILISKILSDQYDLSDKPLGEAMADIMDRSQAATDFCYATYNFTYDPPEGKLALGLYVDDYLRIAPDVATLGPEISEILELFSDPAPARTTPPPALNPL